MHQLSPGRSQRYRAEFNREFPFANYENKIQPDLKLYKGREVCNTISKQRYRSKGTQNCKLTIPYKKSRKILRVSVNTVITRNCDL